MLYSHLDTREADPKIPLLCPSLVGLVQSDNVLLMLPFSSDTAAVVLPPSWGALVLQNPHVHPWVLCSVGSAPSQAPTCQWQKTDTDPAALGIGNIGAAPAHVLACRVVLCCCLHKALL